MNIRRTVNTNLLVVMVLLNQTNACPQTVSKVPITPITQTKEHNLSGLVVSPQETSRIDERNSLLAIPISSSLQNILRLTSQQRLKLEECNVDYRNTNFGRISRSQLSALTQKWDMEVVTVLTSDQRDILGKRISSDLIYMDMSNLTDDPLAKGISSKFLISIIRGMQQNRGPGDPIGGPVPIDFLHHPKTKPIPIHGSLIKVCCCRDTVCHCADGQKCPNSQSCPGANRKLSIN